MKKSTDDTSSSYVTDRRKEWEERRRLEKEQEIEEQKKILKEMEEEKKRKITKFLKENSPSKIAVKLDEYIVNQPDLREDKTRCANKAIGFNSQKNERYIINEEITRDDLFEFGMIGELLSRVATICNTQPMTKEHCFDIVHHSKSRLTIMQGLFLCTDRTHCTSSTSQH